MREQTEEIGRRQGGDRGRFCVSYLLEEKETQNRPLSPPLPPLEPYETCEVL